MVHKLKQSYVLRGWDKMSWVLVHRPENSYKILNAEEFQVLLLCDGKTNFESSYITEEMWIVLKHLKEKGIIEVCEEEQCLEEDQYYRYYNNRFVQSVFWSVTGHCNFRCRHCYMDAPEGALGEISCDDAIELIDQMAECGVLCVDITGGEPFIRNDFWKLIDRIQFHKMTVKQIYTNGWLLTDAVLNELEKRNLKPEISFSFDGVGWHDWMRGVNGAEKAVIRALELCGRRGFPTTVEMCIHRGNQGILRESIMFFSKMGVSRVKVANVSKTDLWTKNSEGNVLDLKAYLETIIQYIPQFFRDGMPIDVMLSNAVALHKKSKKYRILALRYTGTEKCLEYILCGAARCNCYITPEGRLLPCMPMTACKEQNQFPLIQDIGLKKGLSDSYYMNIVDSRVKDLLEANPKCAVCEHKYQCGGGCRATALEQTGDLMGCDGDQCLLWEEGYVERIRQVTEEAIARYCTDDEGIS